MHTLWMYSRRWHVSIYDCWKWFLFGNHSCQINFTYNVFKLKAWLVAISLLGVKWVRNQRKETIRSNYCWENREKKEWTWKSIQNKAHGTTRYTHGQGILQRWKMNKQQTVWTDWTKSAEKIEKSPLGSL